MWKSSFEMINCVIMCYVADPILKYNELYEIIRDEIDCHNGNRPAIVSWLTPKQSRRALNDLSNNPIPSIESIN